MRIPALVSGTLPENCTDPSRRQRTEAQHRLQRASAKLSSKRKGNSPEGRLTVVHLRRFAPLVKMANRKRCLWTPEEEPAAATPGAGGRSFRPRRIDSKPAHGEEGNGGNGPPQTLSVFFLFREGAGRPVARVASLPSCVPARPSRPSRNTGFSETSGPTRPNGLVLVVETKLVDFGFGPKRDSSVGLGAFSGRRS